jgi:hypothetical protein
VRLAWRAEDPSGEIAPGEATLAEIRWWKSWFSEASQVRHLSTRMGKAPSDPVARLWTPLAGQTVEFFVWPDPTGGLALLALFMPDGRAPNRRIAVETTISPEELAAFAATLESEADAISA